jgi:probable phosphoglycerate mutase
MKNTYLVLRHGQSLANVAGIILSELEEGKKEEYTLSLQGEEEVRRSVSRAQEARILDEKVLIVSSPFSRCRKTAEVAKEVLKIDQEILFDDRLRERWFGDWEKTSNANYQRVWDEDRKNPDHTIAQVESANDVQKRTMALIADFERMYQGKTILLVSHGDALQIMQTGCLQQSASLHREMLPLKTAEIRALQFKPE